MRVASITLVAMVAFAANSVLCRVALETTAIDPFTFTFLRLAGGAAILVLVWCLRPKSERGSPGGSWISGFALLGYALAFSLGYVSLDAATGALILFGSVQVTMIGAGLIAGERPFARQWLGIGAALGGLLYLVFPGIESPEPVSAALMALSGASWGLYSVRGKGEASPLRATTGNFLRAFALIVIPVGSKVSAIHPDWTGVSIAVVSGSITSGLGYVLWYRALRELTATCAALVQLSVPVLAALGGGLFLSEILSMRLVIAALMILGGIAAVVLGGAGDGNPCAPRRAGCRVVCLSNSPEAKPGSLRHRPGKNHRRILDREEEES